PSDSPAVAEQAPPYCSRRMIGSFPPTHRSRRVSAQRDRPVTEWKGGLRSCPRLQAVKRRGQDRSYVVTNSASRKGLPNRFERSYFWSVATCQFQVSSLARPVVYALRTCCM